MVFLPKASESFTANIASYSWHGTALSDSFRARHAKQARLVGIASVPFVDKQALLIQSGPHASNMALTPSSRYTL